MKERMLLKAEDVARELNVSLRTAYNIMHEMFHVKRPLRVTEEALQTWIAENTAAPASMMAVTKTPAPRRTKRPQHTGCHIRRI